MNIGDTIKCKDKDECVRLMYALAQDGIFTDFMYEKDGKRGLYLVVIRKENWNEHDRE